MSWKEGLQDSMAEFLRAEGVDAVKVTAYEEDTESDGYCDTCYSEWTVVRMDFENSQGFTESYTYQGDFAELIRALT